MEIESHRTNLIKTTTAEDLVALRRQPTDVQTILLEIYKSMVQNTTAAEVFQQSNNNRFVSSAKVGQREMTKFDSLIYSQLPDDFEGIELSPVAPLGINKVLTNVGQNTVLSTVRNVEVVGDPTTLLAIESARRRKSAESQDLVNLATSQRCIRLQQFDLNSGFTSHFRAFALSTAGRYVGWFEVDQLMRHVGIVLGLFDKVNETGLGKVSNIRVAISNISITERLLEASNADRRFVGQHTQDNNFKILDYLGVKLPEMVDELSIIPAETLQEHALKKHFRVLDVVQERIFPELHALYPEVDYKFDLGRIAGMGYYSGLCYKISAENTHGMRFPLVDGGKSDWVAQLLSNNREHYFSSGFGSELFYRYYIMGEK